MYDNSNAVKFEITRGIGENYRFNKVKFEAKIKVIVLYCIVLYNLHVDCNNIRVVLVFIEIVFCLETCSNSVLNIVVSTNFRPCTL